MAELIALAKQRDGKINVATTGAGAATHLAAALFAERAGVKWEYVPYKGGAQALNDVAANQADLLFNGMLATLPYVNSNRVKLLAVTSDKRWSTLADTPTVAESGFPGFLTGSWQGILAAAKTPGAIIDKLHGEFGKALAVADVRERLIAQGAEPLEMTPKAFGEFLTADTAKWTKVIKEAGIKLE